MEEIKNETIVDEKPKRTTKQKVFLGLEIGGNVIFYLILIALFLFALFNINGGNGTENFPNIFGKGMLNVLSDSMNHEEKEGLEEWKNYPISDGFAKGDLIYASTFKEDTTEDLKIGDVIVFVGKVNGETALVTHRIVDFSNDGKGVVTQGDAAALEKVSGVQQAYISPNTERYKQAISSGKTDDDISTFNGKLAFAQKTETVAVSNIRGVVTSVSAGSGNVLVHLQNNYLFYFVLPVGLLLIFEVFLVIRNIMILRGEKNKAELEGTREAMMADVEAEKERMRQELLAEMRAQGLVISEEPKEEKKEEVVEETKEETPVEENSTEEKVEEPVEEETTETNEEKEEAKEASEE